MWPKPRFGLPRPMWKRPRHELRQPEAGVKRAQASYTRWESEYKRLETLVTQRVLDVQVRDETYRQFEEAAAARDQADAMVSETTSAHVQAVADRDRAGSCRRVSRSPVEGRPGCRTRRPRSGRIRQDQSSVQRRDHPAQREPGRLSSARSRLGRPASVRSRADRSRYASSSAFPSWRRYFIKPGDTGTIRLQAIAGATREGKVVRSGFSLDPFTRTLQTEIDVPNSDDHLHPGWYVTVSIDNQPQAGLGAAV